MTESQTIILWLIGAVFLGLISGSRSSDAQLEEFILEQERYAEEYEREQERYDYYQ